MGHDKRAFAGVRVMTHVIPPARRAASCVRASK